MRFSTRRDVLSGIATTTIVGLAGCNGGGSATDPTGTGTDSGGTTQTRATEFELPSGYGDSGVTDVEAAKTAYLDSLAGTSYAVNFRQEFETPNNEYEESFDYETKRGHIRETELDAEWFFTESEIYFKRPPDDDGDVRYRYSELSADGWETLALGTLDFRMFSRLTDYEYDGPTYTRDGGRRLATFELVGEYSGTVTVSPEGTMYRHVVEDSDGLVYDYETTDVGTATVTKPDWVSEVPTETSSN